MRVSVQFPLHTRSENANRRFGNPYARASATKRERDTVRMMLMSQLPRMKQTVHLGLLDARNSTRSDIVAEVKRLAGGWDPMQPVDNFYRVTIIRIGAGLLDDDNVHGALKAVRDEIAAWLRIKDDHSAPASWRVGQQKAPPGVHAVRIEIEDDDPDQREVHRIVGSPIPKLGPVIGDCAHCGRPSTLMGMLNEAYVREASPPEPATVATVARGLGLTEKALRTLAPLKCRALDRSDKRAAAEQQALVFRRVYYALPGEQDGRDAVLRELPAGRDIASRWSGAGTPPSEMRVKHQGQRMVLQRRLANDFPELGEIWLYEAPASSPRAANEAPHREAART